MQPVLNAKILIYLSKMNSLLKSFLYQACVNPVKMRCLKHNMYYNYEGLNSFILEFLGRKNLLAPLPSPPKPPKLTKKEQDKIYYLNNRERILKQQKKYDSDNKEKRREYMKEYHKRRKNENSD